MTEMLQARVWIQNGRYHVLLPNRRTVGMDQYGNTYGWTPDPPLAAAMWGREVHPANLPAHLRAVIERLERPFAFA